ncbi:hypothetical protein GZH49_02925 [Nocardia terpenica]|uniref:hypothetical protein n=1 Tax=Nocardia terpenica TaxID=455432 RepID=UPI002FE26F86
MKNIGGPLVDAVTAAWAEIQQRHPDTPNVVVTMASGSHGRNQGVRLGRFGADAWEYGPQWWSELFVGAEGLADAPAVLATVLHYAAHGIARTREIKDTSRAGAYHNARYRQIAEEIGLTVERTASRGWAETSLTDATSNRYRSELSTLAQALVAHRRHEQERAASSDDSDPDGHDDGADAGTGERAPRGGSALVCRCEPARRVRAYKKTIDAGPILCGICQQPFLIDLELKAQ